jgi:hypothetical protein
VYLTSANLWFLVFLAPNEINKLRTINQAQNSDSPRLHHFLFLLNFFLPKAIYPRKYGSDGARAVPGVPVRAA